MAPTKSYRPIPSPGVGHCNSALLLLLLLTPRCSLAQSRPSSGNDGPYCGETFHLSTVILMVLSICCLFFMVFYTLYLRPCAGNRTEPGSPSVDGGVGRKGGLDPSVLETFPTLVYSDATAIQIGKVALECAVCLSEFEDNETLRLLPKCSHVFHPDCIDAWLASHVTCPVCRSNLVPDPNAPHPLAAELPAVEPTEGGEGRVDAAPATEHVVITVDEDAAQRERREEAAVVLERIGSRKRTMRPKSGGPPASFPLSHATGNSVVQSGENLDRFTLRLPEHIRRKIVAAGDFPIAGDGSSRRGCRGGGRGGWEGSIRCERSIWLGQSDRRPPFFVREFSAKIPAWAARRRGEGEGEGEGEGSVKKGNGEGSKRGRAPP